MATLKQVALRAGVSTATVSYVLNDSRRVSPATRRRVLEAASTLGYRPNRSAQALRTGRSLTLGLMLPDLTNPFFPALAQAIEGAARRQGYALLLVDCAGKVRHERQGFEVFIERGVDGLVWIPVRGATRMEVPFPVVVVDREVPGFDVIRADHYASGVRLGEYLVSLRHRRAGLLSGPQEVFSARERRRGLLDAIAGRIELAWEVEVPFSLKLTVAAKRALATGDADVIVGANDVVAIAAMRTLERAGMRVPEDVSVVGFDDIPWAALVQPPLTTLRQPLAEMGRRAVELVLARGRDAQLPLRVELVASRLVRRASTRAASDRVSGVVP